MIEWIQYINIGIGFASNQRKTYAVRASRQSLIAAQL